MRNAYRVWSTVGVVTGTTFALSIAIHWRLSLYVVLAEIAVGLCVMLFVGLVTKLLTGHETFVFLREAVPAFIVMAEIIKLVHQPALPYLDVAVLCAGVALAFGRVGCLVVGCCHGRPGKFGICYDEEHTACGFPGHFARVRLFPIQLVESAFVFGLVAVGTRMMWISVEPGMVFGFYVVSYGVGRFFIEFARGDAERPYLWNFSEAQWASLLLLWGAVMAEWREMLPYVRWHVGAAIFVTGCMILISAARRFDAERRFQLRHPKHAREIACAVRKLTVSQSNSATTAAENLNLTSMGVAISGGMIRAKTGELIRNFCVSRRGKPLTRRQAEVLARTIGSLLVPARRILVQAGSPGIFHLLAEEEAPTTRALIVPLENPDLCEKMEVMPFHRALS